MDVASLPRFCVQVRYPGFLALQGGDPNFTDPNFSQPLTLDLIYQYTSSRAGSVGRSSRNTNLKKGKISVFVHMFCMVHNITAKISKHNLMFKRAACSCLLREKQKNRTLEWENGIEV